MSDNQDMDNCSEGDGSWSHPPAITPMYPPPLLANDGPPATVGGPPQGHYGRAPRQPPGTETYGNFPPPYRGPPPIHFPGALTPSANFRGPPPSSDYGGTHGRPPVPGHFGQPPPAGNYERSPSPGRFRVPPPIGNYTRPPPSTYRGPPPIRNQGVPTATGNFVGTVVNESCRVPSSVVNHETNYEVTSSAGVSGYIGPPPPSGSFLGWEPPAHPRTMPESRSFTQQPAVQNESTHMFHYPPGVSQAPPGKTFPATNISKPSHSLEHIPQPDLSRISSKRELKLHHSNDPDIAMAKTAELDEDHRWLKDFEDRITCRKTKTLDNTCQDRTRKLSDAQDMLEKSFVLLHNLEQLKEEMSLKKDTAMEEEWSSLVQQTKDTKEKLEKLEKCLQDESVIQALKQLITKRRKKRLRTRKRKNRKKEEKELMQLAWDKEEEKIDAWKEKFEQEELEKRREKAVQLEADSILGEVRQKQSEAVRMQQLLESLHTLRLARINKGSDHGYVSSQKEDFHFASTQKGINEVVAAQLKEYELEEQTLRVMMGESSTLNKPQRNETSIIITRQEGAVEKLLFGHLAPTDPRATEDFTSAKESWGTLVQRRMEWDQYVTQEETPLASAIPVGWVLPPVHPSTDWAQFQCVAKR